MNTVQVDGSVDLSHSTLGEVSTWLYDEAELLDAREFGAWFERCSKRLKYWMPVRMTVPSAAGAGISDEQNHFEENYASMDVRVRRQAVPSGWSEDPPSRTRRFVTNIRVVSATDDELVVKSYLLVLRSRLDSPTFEFLSAERNDVLVREDGKLRLSSRRIVVDQSTLGAVNLALIY